MLKTMTAGTYLDSVPVPHDPQATTYHAVGSITVGLEYRVFDPVAERLKYTDEEIAATGPDSLFHRDDADEGICVHVFATDGLGEYLRFDCFRDEPHYHYIDPDVGNVLIHYDDVANGPMAPWIIDVLRTRSPEMLSAIGAVDLAASVDVDALGRLLDELAPTILNQAPRTTTRNEAR